MDVKIAKQRFYGYESMATAGKRVQRIVLELIRDGHTRKEIAEATGSSKGAVSQWENGTEIRTELKARNILGLASLSGYSPWWILNETGPERFDVPEQLSARVEILIEYIKGLTPQQQEALKKPLRTAVEANRTTEKFMLGGIRTAGDPDVLAALGLPGAKERIPVHEKGASYKKKRPPKPKATP